MRQLKNLASALAVGLALCPLVVVSQEPAHPPNLMETLNKEAEATDPAGIHKYCQHLIQLLVGDKTGKAYAATLADRLARAETMARHGKSKLIPEADVARSFNDLMKQIGAPASLHTDEAWVKKFRAGPLAASPVPALITADRNGVDCNPGEAVFLLFLLIYNNGSFDDRLPHGLKMEDLPRVSISGRPQTEPTSSGLLSTYDSQHPRSDTIKVFDSVAQTLHF
jgi:hypothetical protein